MVFGDGIDNMDDVKNIEKTDRKTDKKTGLRVDMEREVRGFLKPSESKQRQKSDNKLIYIPVDRVWTRKWAKTRNLTFEELLIELRENFNSPYIVKLKWLEEPKRSKQAYYTIYKATLDISGDYFILERINEDERDDEKPKLVVPQFELERLIQLNVVEVYRRRKTVKEYREEKELYEITTW